MIYQKGSNLFNVAIYIRLSREDGDKEESDSVGNQRKLLTEYVNKHDDFILYDVYIDDGFTGTNFNRPDFHRMIADIEDNKVNCVVVKDLSRFGRDYIDTGRYLERIFPELNVRFISVTDNIDSMKQAYDMLLPIKNIFNEQYARDISNKIQATVKSKQKAGEFIGAFTSYGYKKSPANKNKLVIDEYASEVVKRVFTMYAQGIGKQSIAKILNAEGILCPSEYKKLNGENYKNCNRLEKTSYWTYSTIKVMLQNELYIGNMVQGKRRTSLYDNEARHATDENDWIVVENTHEAIVDKELFNKVRAVMYKKVEESIFTSDRGKNLPIKEDIFAGILFCGNCGRRIPLASRILEKDGVLERQYFYSCRYNYDFGGKQCGCTIMEQELIKVVHNLLTTQIAVLTDSDRTEASMRGVMDRELKEHDMRIQKIQKQIDRKNYEESKEYQSYVTGEITRADFKCRQKKNADAIMRLWGQITDEEASRRRVKRFCEKKIQWLKAIYRFQSEVSLDRNMIKILVDSIYLYPDKRLVINLNFKDEYARMTDGEEI